MYRIDKIYEVDFGCEEHKNKEAMALLYLVDEIGNTKHIEVSENFLSEHKLEEGSEYDFE